MTGALGCLGAWTLKALLDQGEEPVAYDLGATTPGSGSCSVRTNSDA